MNRPDANKIAETITNEQLLQMFNSAKDNIVNWNRVSNINKGMTRGAAWNVLAKDFNVNKDYKVIIKYNMIREFGKYLPDELKPIRKNRTIQGNPPHQEPNFDNY